MYHAVVHRQVLIVKWLLENFSLMLYSGMDNEAFDNYIPAVYSGQSLHNAELDMKDKAVAERLRCWFREFGLSQLLQYGSNEYSEDELKVIQEGPSAAVLELYGLRMETARQSPLHYLLMNNFRKFATSDRQRDFLHVLKAMGLSAVPANWCKLVLALNPDEQMRSDAKALLSQNVLTMPDDKRDTDIQLPKSVVDSWGNHMPQSKFEDFVGQLNVDALPLLTIADNPGEFNLW